MTESQQTPLHHHDKKNHRKKAIFTMLGRTCSSSGWLGLLYFISFQYSIIGIILSIILIILGDMLDVYANYT
jgi:hypothetical protein